MGIRRQLQRIGQAIDEKVGMSFPDSNYDSSAREAARVTYPEVYGKLLIAGADPGLHDELLWASTELAAVQGIAQS